MSTESDQEATIALKYLEIARAEILERLKLSNQFLIAYLGGISILLGWFFAARDTANHGMLPQQVLPAVAAVVSFLAFSLTWVLSENERMIELLARYQRDQLVQSLPSPPMWEGSLVLSLEKPHIGAMAVHALIINAPNIVMIGASLLHPTQLSACLRWIYTSSAIVLSVSSILISANMILRRRELRSESSPSKTQERIEPKQ